MEGVVIIVYLWGYGCVHAHITEERGDSSKVIHSCYLVHFLCHNHSPSDSVHMEITIPQNNRSPFPQIMDSVLKSGK